jgi:hypothetical protein
MAATEGPVRTGDRHDEPLDGHTLHPGPGEGEQLAESFQLAASSPPKRLDSPPDWIGGAATATGERLDGTPCLRNGSKFVSGVGQLLWLFWNIHGGAVNTQHQLSRASGPSWVSFAASRRVEKLPHHYSICESKLLVFLVSIGCDGEESSAGPQATSTCT